MSANINDKVVSVLNELIETCKDGAKGFAVAAADAKAPNLKELFGKYAAQRNSFAADLDGFVVSYRGEPAESGHVAATVHRGWINLKTAVTGNDDKAILNECERGEDYAKKAYIEALKEELPAEVLTVVRRQANEIVAAHDAVRDLRDHANALESASKAYPNTIDSKQPVYRD
ncbi:MAG: PA2169 family four-helix-bundle protein [Gemmatimonadaceae bacterium]